MANFEKLAQQVAQGKSKAVLATTQALVNEGVAPLDIINKGLVMGMSEIGVLFREGKAFVPQVLLGAKAMQTGLDVVQPLLEGQEMQKSGTVLIATVQGDHHDIGKNLVAIMMRSHGYDVVDLGKDVANEAIVEKVKEIKPDVIAMSALLTTTMLNMKSVVELLQEEGLRENVKVIIGGAPVSQDFATEIKADGYSGDAMAAVELCQRLLA